MSNEQQTETTLGATMNGLMVCYGTVAQTEVKNDFCDVDQTSIDYHFKRQPPSLSGQRWRLVVNDGGTLDRYYRSSVVEAAMNKEVATWCIRWLQGAHDGVVFDCEMVPIAMRTDADGRVEMLELYGQRKSEDTRPGAPGVVNVTVRIEAKR